jgi:hypothetical protein
MAAPQSTHREKSSGAARSRTSSVQTSNGKKQCTNRAAWRVQPGKPPERLSPHYRLDCEYGSSLVLSWKNEGYEPVYVCEEHAKSLGSLIETPAPARNPPADPLKIHERKPLPEPAKPASNAPPPSTAPAAPAPPPKPASIPPAMLPKPHKSAKTSDDRRASINRLIGELSTELENNLAQSEAVISAVDTIDGPLDQALQELIANPSITDSQKDTAAQQLGALQEFLKHSTTVELGALKAYRLQQTVQGYLRSDINIVTAAKPGYRAVCESLRAAIHSAVPKSKHLEERLENVFAMKAELENLIDAKEFALPPG